MKRIILYLAILVVGVALTGWMFLDYSKSFYSYAEPRFQSTDAVVVLTGGRGRLSKALSIFSNLDDPQVLFVAGVKEANTLETIFPDEDLRDIKQEKIVLDKASTSTHENALNARNYLIQHKIQSIVLVTSNYHMKRALYIFETIFPENIDIIPHPVESDLFNLTSWWLDGTSMKIVFQECLKYWWYRALL